MYWLARRGGTPWAKLGGALPRKEDEHKKLNQLSCDL